ncbi:unnamed protein product (macronuclear) [Paramecium tetraurelia]|uniref:Glycosyltransferase 2-like domain-containing protein n=1 Tax=Paramecium tetraurelia TaxID=5888 RepID=A0EA18_PARTE|nr:uncharacterized protein GSPATT00024866001 [Paramecium tetraurelia]CAK92135.1 unnamed protein product [Paramecium tetraurelia]|eukprot:XP_001459532.1 hypothetical protein (macronuclear) [Paramecium tetraurelia strain d4-2]
MSETNQIQRLLISSELPENPIATKMTLKEDKTCGGRFRWNLVINAIMIAMAAFPFYLPLEATLGINCFYASLWLLFTCLAVNTLSKIHNTIKKSFPYQIYFDHIPLQRTSRITLKTLQNVSQQRIAKEIILVVCMEEKTPDKESKINAVFEQFTNFFGKLIITVHPYGTPGEIPGKCSNNNYGIRSVYAHLKQSEPNFDPNKYFVTNFDVDNIFHKNFLDIQMMNILKEKDRNNYVWQPVLFYNWGLDKLSVFTRITGLARNMLMMGALIPFNINIMSVYTASLQLYIEGDFCHPTYQMEDIICYIRWKTLSKRSLKIKPIYCPTISGPTSGSNMWQEFVEWVRQNKRWSVGSAEVFHYFVIKASRVQFCSAFLWACNYLNYYASFICVQSLLLITTTIRLFAMESDPILQQYFCIPLIMVYICLFFMIFMNKLAVKYLLNDIVIEKIPIWKDFIHWILSLLVMVGYGLTIFYGFWEIFFCGKGVCTHEPSKKKVLDNIVQRKDDNIVQTKDETVIYVLQLQSEP